jgi:hypothetical protein
MMEALSSSETSVLTRPTLRNVPEDGILHSHRRENLKSYGTSNVRLAMICLDAINLANSFSRIMSLGLLSQ